MTSIVGRGIRIEIGIAEATAIALTTPFISKADPAVATSAGHSLLAKSVGYLTNVGGMVQLEGQAVRFSAVDTNTLTLEDLDTTNYGTCTGGNLVMISEWATLGTITSYTVGGGAGEKLDDTTLIDVIKREVQGLLAAQTLSFSLNAATRSDSAMQRVRKLARNSGYAVFRITLPDGAVRVFRGQPSLPGENVQKNAIGTGDFSVTVSGFVLEGSV